MAQAKRAVKRKLDSRTATAAAPVQSARRPSSRSPASAKSPAPASAAVAGSVPDPVTGAVIPKVFTRVCRSKTCGKSFETMVPERIYCTLQCGNRERQRQQRCRHRELRLAAEKAEGGSKSKPKSKSAGRCKPKPKSVPKPKSRSK